jgi:hypothetical protein
MAPIAQVISAVQLLFFSSSHVLMVKNTLSGRFISFDGSNIVATLAQTAGVYMRTICAHAEHAISTDNFIVEDINANRYLRPYNSVSNKLHKVPGNSCIAGMDTNSDGSLIHTSPIGANTGVNVFIMDAGVRWYLRVDFVTRAVSLECQTELDNVSSALVQVLAESNIILLCLILAA